MLNEALRLLPNENYVFFSDSQNNPYGDKSDGEIIARSKEIARFLINEKHCKAMVIACNTASAKAARSLRAQFTQIPIAAIEPAYKVVHDENPQGKTLIMATKGTIKSEKFRRLYYSYYNHKTCIHSCPGLADLIEKGGKEELEEYLRKTLAPYRGEVQNVVLGDIRFFDGAPGTARRLEYLLRSKDILNNGSNAGEVEFIDSSVSEEIRKIKTNRFYNLLMR